MIQFNRILKQLFHFQYKQIFSGYFKRFFFSEQSFSALRKL